MHCPEDKRCRRQWECRERGLISCLMCKWQRRADEVDVNKQFLAVLVLNKQATLSLVLKGQSPKYPLRIDAFWQVWLICIAKVRYLSSMITVTSPRLHLSKIESSSPKNIFKVWLEIALWFLWIFLLFMSISPLGDDMVLDFPLYPKMNYA